MTTRTLTATRPGPVALSVDLPAGDIKVITDPSRTVAEVTVTARGDDDAVHGAVRNAVLDYNESTGALNVRVRPAPGGVSITGPDLIVSGAVISGAVVNVGGRVIVNGVEITGGTMAAGGRVEITAHVPDGSTVAALTQSAPLACSGEFAEVGYTSVSGDLSVGGVGALRVKTTSGDVYADAVDGAAVVRSVSGDIYLGLADDVTVASTSGDVTVNDFAGRAEISTVSGDVRALPRAAPSRPGRCRVTSR